MVLTGGTLAAMEHSEVLSLSMTLHKTTMTYY